MQTDGRTGVAALGTQLLEGRDAIGRGVVAALIEPPESVIGARIKVVIDVPVGEDVDAGRQWSNAQPVAGLQHEQALGIGTDYVAAGVAFRAEFACGDLCGRGGVGTTEQIAHEQAAAARLLWHVQLWPIGDRDQDAAFVDGEPGAAADRVTTAGGAQRPVEQLRWFAAARVELLAVGTDYQGRVLDHAKEERKQTHNLCPLCSSGVL